MKKTLTLLLWLFSVAAFAQNYNQNINFTRTTLFSGRTEVHDTIFEVVNDGDTTRYFTRGDTCYIISTAGKMVLSPSPVGLVTGVPLNRIAYGTGNNLTSDALFTRDTATKKTVIAYKPLGSRRTFKLEFSDSLKYVNENGNDTAVWQPRAVLSYGLDSITQMHSYSALQILDESKAGGSENKVVLGYQSAGGAYGMNYIVEPEFLRMKVRDSIADLSSDYDFYPNTWKMDDKTNGVQIYVNWLSAPDSGHVLSMVGDSAKWQPSSTSQADSVTIYALTPRPGTQYYCTDCSGNGIIGRIVAYIGSAWRRLLFE